jgi:probable HAF family extracellular repeat protein
MTIIRGSKIRGFILAAAFSAGLGFATSASAQVRSYVIDLNSKTATGIGTDSRAQGINNAGQVVGESETAGVPSHAFITGPDGMGMRDLGTLGGDRSEASGINDTGQVVGHSVTAQGNHAFITGPDGMGMRDLGTFGGTGLFDRSNALGINDAGQVVGQSLTAGGDLHAFITGPDGAGMMDLNSLVDVPGGLVLREATSINNSGQVIAIAVPEPEIYALFLAGLALVGFVARRRKMGGEAFGLG